jgi:hypothetical protein
MPKRRRASAVAAVTAARACKFRPGAAKGPGENVDRVEDILGGRRASAVRAREVREVARALDGLFGCLLHSGPCPRRQLHDHSTTVRSKEIGEQFHSLRDAV